MASIRFPPSKDKTTDRTPKDKQTMHMVYISAGSGISKQPFMAEGKTRTSLKSSVLFTFLDQSSLILVNLGDSGQLGPIA